jgi:tetratricopeptide (TPR) repeat protein
MTWKRDLMIVLAMLVASSAVRAEHPAACWCDPAIQNAPAPLFAQFCEAVSALAADAVYFDAVRLQSEGLFPSAADKFVRLLESSSFYRRREDVLNRLFDIANCWYDDARDEMQQLREVREGKRLFVVPRIVNLDKRKPVFGAGRRATQLHEKICRCAPNSPLAEKALFLRGTMPFFREDYSVADRCFSELVERFPHGELAAQAIELAIISKHQRLVYEPLGNAENQLRLIDEALRLIEKALENYGAIKEDPEKRVAMRRIQFELQIGRMALLVSREK